MADTNPSMFEDRACRRTRLWAALSASVVLALLGACAQDSAEATSPPGVPSSSSLEAGADGDRHADTDGGDGARPADAHSTPSVTMVETRPATSHGLDTFSANGRIQPGGRPTTYYFEYGATTS